MPNDGFTVFGISAEDESGEQEMKDILRSTGMRDFVEKIVIPAHHQIAHDAILTRDDKVRLIEAGRYEILSELIQMSQDV